MKTNKNQSRRKFITNVGLATGAIAVMPKLGLGNSTPRASLKNQGSSKADDQRHPALARYNILKSAKVLRRSASIAHMPLAQRPL
ncbi:MAG TPA: twin-arginine translocation signal domain-containing protein [Opitutales bacterium]|nr:twin-arginine translocation signal domain-containing protein [Opitutales bacterium]